MTQLLKDFRIAPKPGAALRRNDLKSSDGYEALVVDPAKGVLIASDTNELVWISMNEATLYQKPEVPSNE